MNLRVISIFKFLNQRGGNFKNIIYIAFQLFQREGLSGIKRGLHAVITSGRIRPTIGSDNFDRNDYDEWIKRYDTISEEMRVEFRTAISGFAKSPLISVVMPTYNSNLVWLRLAIESVQGQIYQNWELCIADDASTNPAVRSVLESYAKLDSRIKISFRHQNGHISAASNSALKTATGEWIALLDHDDLLSEQALFWVAEAINKFSDIRMIYSDEDKINQLNKRSNPYFKCDWNQSLFYSHNLISHLGVYQAALLKKIGGFRIGFEGAQDYDLALRFIEQIRPNQIYHIPKVLYHWRIHAESTSHSNEAKPYAMLAGEKALNEHLKRKNINGTAKLEGPNFRIRYNLPATQPLVSLMIPTRNGLQLIRQCIKSILEKTTYTNYEILIIDNGSDDPKTIEYLDSLKCENRIRVLHDDRPFNYSALNNQAVLSAKGELVLLLNNDVEVISSDWLSELVSIALQPSVGAVGAKLLYANDTVQHAGVILGMGGGAGHAHKRFPVWHPGYFGRASVLSEFSAVTGACLIVRKQLYQEFGGLNEKDLAIAFNDIDFCLKLSAAGYRNIYTPYAMLYHHESSTRGFDDTPEKLSRLSHEMTYMKKKWIAQFTNDPAYNPSLTLVNEDFSLSWPPRNSGLR